MRNLYIDCDGVIFDTVKFAFQEMDRLKIDIRDDLAVTKYFENIDWHYLIQSSGPINNSIEKIRLLVESDEFASVQVATHRCSYEEGVVKTSEFAALIPNLKIITIPRKIQKHHAVNARNNMLIDDEPKKIRAWVDDGGIGVLFSKNVDHLIYPYELGDHQYYVTNDLLDTLIINRLEKEKVYRR